MEVMLKANIFTNKTGSGFIDYDLLIDMAATIFEHQEVDLFFSQDKLVARYDDKNYSLTNPGRLRAFMELMSIDFKWYEGGDVTREDLLEGLAFLAAEEIDNVGQL